MFEARPTLSIIEIPAPKMPPPAALNKAPCGGVNCVRGTGEWRDAAVSCGPHENPHQNREELIVVPILLGADEQAV